MKYGNEKTDTDIISLLKHYDLLSLFNNNTNELQKIVEINGTNISMGIQKIIFLIRGILKSDCSIYIFDEPLTSLDMNTRKKVMNMINNIIDNKTTIIITHDIEINSIVDRVIKLDTNN
jgi:ABC-type transport system involved in cytochrome bd biosynthesis fused ATPase/permease subunit